MVVINRKTGAPSSDTDTDRQTQDTRAQRESKRERARAHERERGGGRTTVRWWSSTARLVLPPPIHKGRGRGREQEGESKREGVRGREGGRVEGREFSKHSIRQRAHTCSLSFITMRGEREDDEEERGAG
eukprot:2904529-Rhodomonas_salina.1